MAPDLERTDRTFATVFFAMSAVSQPTHGCQIPASKASLVEVPSSNGKTQPWKEAWPPRRLDLQDVAEAQGQMLLLDGTGGSGTKAVPNAVYLPPKENGVVNKGIPVRDGEEGRPQSNKEDREEKNTAQTEEAKSEKP